MNCYRILPIVDTSAISTLALATVQYVHHVRLSAYTLPMSPHSPNGYTLSQWLHTLPMARLVLMTDDENNDADGSFQTGE
jgi:hypothetical protein